MTSLIAMIVVGSCVDFSENKTERFLAGKSTMIYSITVAIDIVLIYLMA
jgi:hypothetical protein